MPLKLVITLCATFFVLGGAGLYLMVSVVNAARRRSQRAKKGRSNSQKVGNEKKAMLDRVGTMNLILFLLGAALVWFTVTMIDLFKTYGSVPDTLINCVFLICGGECGVMGWIKTTKERFRDRQYELEDREHEEKRQEATSGILDRNAPGDAG